MSVSVCPTRVALLYSYNIVSRFAVQTTGKCATKPTSPQTHNAVKGVLHVLAFVSEKLVLIDSAPVLRRADVRLGWRGLVGGSHGIVLFGI